MLEIPMGSYKEFLLSCPQGCSQLGAQLGELYVLVAAPTAALLAFLGGVCDAWLTRAPPAVWHVRHLAG